MSQNDSTDSMGGSVVWNVLALIAFLVMVGFIVAEVILVQMSIWQVVLAAFVSTAVCDQAMMRAAPAEGEQRDEKDSRGVFQGIGFLVSFIVFLANLVLWGYVAWPWI